MLVHFQKSMNGYWEIGVKSSRISSSTKTAIELARSDKIIYFGIMQWNA